jgi:hypothetical protein
MTAVELGSQIVSDPNLGNGEPVVAGTATCVPPFGDYDNSGVDLSLLRMMLGLSPTERLRLMEKHAQDTLRLLDYGREHRKAKAIADR